MDKSNLKKIDVHWPVPLLKIQSENTSLTLLLAMFTFKAELRSCAFVNLANTVDNTYIAYFYCFFKECINFGPAYVHRYGGGWVEAAAKIKNRAPQMTEFLLW